MLGVSSCHHGKMERIAKERRAEATENWRKKETLKTQGKKVMLK